MIHESSPWKATLAKDADMMDRWAARPGRSERRSFLLERKVFLVAYALRKLDEANKLSTATLSEPIAISRYPPTRSGYSAANTHRFDEYFDLEHPQSSELSARRLINILIHSLVFVEVCAVDWTVEGFLVTSDYEATRGLVKCDLSAFTRLARRAARDFPSTIVRWLDIETGKWCVWAGQGNPPATAMA